MGISKTALAIGITAILLSGTLSYADGDKYEGEHKDGLRNGRGTFTWADGGSLEANWDEGVPGGNAKWSQADDDYYVGGIKGSK